MNPLSVVTLMLAIAATFGDPGSLAAGAGPEEELGFLRPPGSSNRELYTECTENGRTVTISESCCAAIASVQRSAHMYPSTSCEQMDTDDFVANMATYCQLAPGGGGGLNCTYDVKTDNKGCSDQIQSDCLARGGRIFASNITLSCGHFTMKIQNSLTCLGSSCTRRDVQEYLWVGEFTQHDSLSTCQVTEINGQSLKSRKRNDAITTAIVRIFAVGLLGFFIWSRSQSHRHRHRHTAVPDVRAVAMPQTARPAAAGKPPHMSAFDAEFA